MTQDELSTMEKGLRPLPGDLSDADIPALNWNLLREDLSLPCAVLYREKLQHNLRWMQWFAAEYGVKLAPHGKTTMAPKLFAMQMDAGAWGITLATAQQTEVAYRFGVRRVLMANQLVGRQNMEVISALLRDPYFEYYCLVDSAEGAEMLGSFYSASKQRLRVLLELGADGGRTGIRNEKQLHNVLAALERWRDSLALCGVEIYEGVLNDETSIRDLLARAVTLTRKLAAEGRFACKPILSGAGSAWYDVVAEAFTDPGFGNTVDIVLRPGCYLTHDVGGYREAQEKILTRSPVAAKMRAGLLPALQVWAYVQSVPELDKAIVGIGKRDASFDSGLPVPALRFRPGDAEPAAAPPSWTVTRMMDQHAFLQITPGDDVRVGDMIAFDISHPCLTFDKWRVLAMLDPQYNVVDVIRTFF
jgi:D-serine dehydratase